jgi:hypothetical protein
MGTGGVSVDKNTCIAWMSELQPHMSNALKFEASDGCHGGSRNVSCSWSPMGRVAQLLESLEIWKTMSRYFAFVSEDVFGISFRRCIRFASWAVQNISFHLPGAWGTKTLFEKIIYLWSNPFQNTGQSLIYSQPTEVDLVQNQMWYFAPVAAVEASREIPICLLRCEITMKECIFSTLGAVGP